MTLRYITEASQALAGRWCGSILAVLIASFITIVIQLALLGILMLYGFASAFSGKQSAGVSMVLLGLMAASLMACMAGFWYGLNAYVL
jgi:hypothetical protein